MGPYIKNFDMDDLCPERVTVTSDRRIRNAATDKAILAAAYKEAKGKSIAGWTSHGHETLFSLPSDFGGLISLRVENDSGYLVETPLPLKYSHPNPAMLQISQPIPGGYMLRMTYSRKKGGEWGEADNPAPISGDAHYIANPFRDIAKNLPLRRCTGCGTTFPEGNVPAGWMTVDFAAASGKETSFLCAPCGAQAWSLIRTLDRRASGHTLKPRR